MDKRFIAGILLVVVGIIILLNQLDIIRIGELLRTWWPSVLIIIGVVQLSTRSSPPVGAVLLIAIGAVLQVGRLHLFGLNTFQIVIPATLIFIGAWLLLGKGSTNQAETDDEVNYLTIFGGLDKHLSSPQFRGGSIVTVFGGVELNLKNSILSGENANLDITTIFGGAEIIVPQHWRVIVSGIPVFGAIENKTERELKPTNSPTLRVRSLTLFGGLDIKN